MRPFYRALGGALLLAALAGCGAVTTAQSGAQPELPTAPPAPTSPPAATPVPAPDAPSLGGDALLRDEFDSQLDGWRVQDIVDFPYGEPSTWLARDGRVDLISGPDGYALELPTLLLAGDPAWRDYTIEALANSRGNERIGLAGRASDKGLYAMVLFADRVALLRFDAADQTWTGLATSDAARQTPGAWTALALRFEGAAITGFVDGAPVVSASDAAYPAGQAGLYGYAQGSLSFDRVAVFAK